MDISDINKVANRKKLTANAEKLREKISRENRNIIKLKVAQDTAYWDLKEQLRQVESNHEKLQANMVDVQMQHEAISGQYQDELRLRPETLNKLGSTREICDVLEDYSERLRDTLSRCKADQASLYEAYQKSGQVVRDIKTQQLQADEKNKQLIKNLKEKVKLTTEHHSQLLQYFSAEKQKSDAALLEVKTKLSAAQAKRDELVASGSELSKKLELCRHELEKREETVARLQNDIKQLIQEFTAQGTEMQNTLLKQERELKETNSANESLKQALANQEQFTKSVYEQKDQLQDKVAALEDSLGAADNLVKELKSQLEEAVLQENSLKKEIETANEKNQSFEKDIIEKNLLLTNAETEIQNLKLQLATLEAEKLQVLGELTKAGDDTKGLEVKIQELTAAGVGMEAKIADIEVQLRECREKADQKVQELTSTIESKDRELDSKASAIGQLMSEVKAGSDVRGRLEMALEMMRKEMDIEREAVCERERKMGKQIEQLECSVRNKDQELSNQMNIILELRGDKERLHVKIQHMQNKIDNIQKELTAGDNSSGRRERLQPEQDDNAVMLTPAHKKTTPPPNTQPDFAVPKNDPKFDSMVLNFLSDSSMDGDKTLDAGEVTRRFEALSRGGRVSPAPLASLKRRRSGGSGGSGVPAAPGGLRFKTSNNDDLISLSQVKDDVMKAKERSFFKNKRQDTKPKKYKQTAAF